MNTDNLRQLMDQQINSLYDVQALIQCATSDLEDEEIAAFRVLRQAERITQEVIDILDTLSPHNREIERIAELVKSDGAPQH